MSALAFIFTGARKAIRSSTQYPELSGVVPNHLPAFPPAPPPHSFTALKTDQHLSISTNRPNTRVLSHEIRTTNPWVILILHPEAWMNLETCVTSQLSKCGGTISYVLSTLEQRGRGIIAIPIKMPPQKAMCELQ